MFCYAGSLTLVISNGTIRNLVTILLNTKFKCLAQVPKLSIHDHPMAPIVIPFDQQTQSELPRSIPRNSVESDHGCTSRTYFDNAGENVTLTLYNVTLTSQKPC